MYLTDTTYNSDLSTYDLFKELQDQFHQYRPTSDWRSESPHRCIEITEHFVHTVIYPKMKDDANALAEKIAHSAANQKERWQSPMPIMLVHQLMEILFSRGIRRGPIPSEPEELHKRARIILESLSSDDGLRFSILMLPNRDVNEAKNDGYLPDLGEIITLLQLWSIVKAMLIATQKCAESLIQIFSRVVRSVNTMADVQNHIMSMMRRKTAPIGISEPVDKANRLDRLRDEVKRNYDVLDDAKMDRLVRELARRNLTVTWFLDSVEQVCQIQARSIRLYVVQDPRRYASYDTDSQEHIEAYAASLKEITKNLGIDQHIIITSHDLLEQQYSATEKLQMFTQLKQEVYSEKFDRYSRPFYQHRANLFQCTTRESFLAMVDHLSLNENIPPLIEPVLFGRNHPELHNSQLRTREKLSLLAKIYEPYVQDAKMEQLRQDLLFSTVINAIKYLCSYESQTQTKNKYQLDDIQFLLPGTVRLSIHNKPSACGQFLIKCGPNMHRQPWHGTAGLRLRNNKGMNSMSFEVRLSFEYKVGDYIPIFIKKEQKSEFHNSKYLFSLACINQPILWVHADLVQLYLTNENDLSGLFDQNNKIRMI